MAYEMIELHLNWRNEGFIFRTRYKWWEAHQLTSKGPVVVAKSEEFQFNPSVVASLADLAHINGPNAPLPNSMREIGQEYQVLSRFVAGLLSQGWEPLSVDNYGHVQTMKRTK